MLIRLAIAEAIAAGTIRVQYRRWAKRRVKAGTWIHTPAGVVVVDSISECDPESLTDDDARAAGSPRSRPCARGFGAPTVIPSGGSRCRSVAGRPEAGRIGAGRPEAGRIGARTREWGCVRTTICPTTTSPW